MTTSIVNGAWAHFPITVPAGGSALITVDRTAGMNAVLSGLFLGDARRRVPERDHDGRRRRAWPGTPRPRPAGNGHGRTWAWTLRRPRSAAARSRASATRDGASPGGRDLHHGHRRLHDQRPRTNGTDLHLHGLGSQRGWHRSGLGSGQRHAGCSGDGAGCTDGPQRHGRQRSGRPGLDGARLVNGGSPITGYTATASPGGATCTTASLGCTISGLTNGTTYTFTVRADNAVGSGPASAPASATPVAPATVPGAPTGLTATAGNGQVVLAWTAPASNGGSPITGYTATASPGGATCTTASLGCTISGLANGTTYTFTVRASNAVGPGAASAPDSATPVAPATVPGAPTGLTATTGPTTPGAAPTTGGSQVRLAWTAPASTGGSPITGYRIYRGTVSGGRRSSRASDSSPATPTRAPPPGSTYFYQVAALNAMGEGARSAEASIRPAVVGETPRAPEDLKARMKANGQVRLSWSPPSRHNRSHVTGYRIYRSTSSGTEKFLVAVGNVTTYVDATAPKGVRYYYQVSAVNAAGEGPRSKERGVGRGNDGGDQGDHDGGHGPHSPGVGT